MLTQELLKSLLHYNPETGVFTWLKNRTNGVKTGDIAGHRFKCGTNTYIRITILGTQYLAHRMAWLYMYGGDIPQKLDHIDNIGINNTINNIRAATNGQNKANSKSKIVKGAYKSGHRWRAQIKHNNKIFSLGSYATADEAHKAYCDAADKLHGDFSNHG